MYRLGRLRLAGRSQVSESLRLATEKSSETTKRESSGLRMSTRTPTRVNPKVEAVPDPSSESSLGGRDRALSRIVAEIHDGLRHGFFEYVLTCEIVGHERRRRLCEQARATN